MSQNSSSIVLLNLVGNIMDGGDTKDESIADCGVSK
eukprot:SAG11_NODE_23482_length_388_cov_0.529412_1_plen_35_part_10